MKQFYNTFLAAIPLIAPIWEKQPPVQDDLKTPITYQATEAAVSFQAEGMDFFDGALRMRLIHNLAAANHQKAAEILLRLINESENPDMAAAALSQIHRLPFPKAEITENILAFLDHSNPGIRYWSLRLIADLPLPAENLNSILEMAENDPSPRRSGRRCRISARFCWYPLKFPRERN